MDEQQPTAGKSTSQKIGLILGPILFLIVILFFDLDQGKPIVTRMAAVALLIGLGALWLLTNVGILPRLFSVAWAVVGVLFWPALLIGAGYLLLRNSGRAKAA